MPSMADPAPDSSFSLALLQMRLDPGDRASNLARVQAWLERAASAGAEVVLLPEALPFGWMSPAGRTGAHAIPDGADYDFFRQKAIEFGFYLCTGLVERSGPNIYNAAVLIAPDGQLLLHHRKIFELGIAHECYDLGDRLGVAQTPLGRIGLMICADGFAPGQVLSRALGMMGAQIILSPSAWAVPPAHDNLREPYGGLWLDNYGPVARAHGLWIAACSNVGAIKDGSWAGHQCIGSSMVLDPMGAVSCRGLYGVQAEQLLQVKIALRPIRRPAAG